MTIEMTLNDINDINEWHERKYEWKTDDIYNYDMKVTWNEMTWKWNWMTFENENEKWKNDIKMRMK